LRLVREWRRHLNLLDRPVHELFPLCETCPPLFRQLGDAPRVVSVTEFKHRLDAGLNTVDEDVLSRLSTVLPSDDLRETGIAGIGVPIASRVLSQARAGEVLVSAAVPMLVAGSGFEFDDRGEHQLKGMQGMWRLYAVRG
jgi:class 3 adenylate cyclase